MTYSSGGLIQAADFNTFQTNLNSIWSTGSTDRGWGQTALSAVSTGGTVTATNWASLVNTLATAGSQTVTTETARTAPVTGNVIAILANVATDITNCTTNRGNTAVAGVTNQTWTGNVSRTAASSNGTNGAWTIIWTQTITFPSAAQARYFWNAGGQIRMDFTKTSTGTDIDPDWNTFVGTVGILVMTGRVNGASQSIAGSTYTGFTRIGGSGTPVPNLTTTGWYTLVAGAAATTMFQLNSTVSPYTGDYIQITAAKDATSTILTLTTSWRQVALTGAGETTNISGGTATTSPFSVAGTAPTVLTRVITPGITYLTNSWGTPVVNSAVVQSVG